MVIISVIDIFPYYSNFCSDKGSIMGQKDKNYPFFRSKTENWYNYVISLGK